MELKKLGTYTKPLKKTSHDLSAYSVDQEGQVWSNNRRTYFTRYGRAIKRGEGKDGTVTLRDADGRKVSIARSKLMDAFGTNRTGRF